MLKHGPQNVTWKVREQNSSTNVHELRKVNSCSSKVVDKIIRSEYKSNASTPFRYIQYKILYQSI
jgi:hypothetical protein